MEPTPNTPHENSLKTAIIQQNLQGEIVTLKTTKNLAEAINQKHKDQKSYPDHKFTLIPNWELVQKAVQAIPAPNGPP